MRASLAFTSAGRWFSVRLEAAGALVLLAVGLLCWGLRATVSPSLAGLALVWAVRAAFTNHTARTEQRTPFP